MGPEATVLLMQRVIEATPATDDAEHIPLLIDSNTRVPSRIRHLIERRPDAVDPGPVLAAMARRLEAMGATALAMPCNTAHHYAPALRAAVDIPLLHVVEIAADRLSATVPAGAAVGLLGSPALTVTRLFDEPLAEVGLDVLHPDAAAGLLGAIRRIKAGTERAGARRTLADAARSLESAGAAALLVACSEFSVERDAIEASVPVYDTMDLLAGAIVAAGR